MPDEFLDRLSAEQRAASWQRGLARFAEAGQAQLVVEDDDGEVAGFVVTGPTRSGEGTGEVRVLNVEPTRWGRGLGCLLLAAAVEELRSGGHAAAILWVVEGNVRARRFYESAGWHFDGGTMVDDRFGTGLVEVRYRLQLQDTSTPSSTPGSELLPGRSSPPTTTQLFDRDRQPHGGERSSQYRVASTAEEGKEAHDRRPRACSDDDRGHGDDRPDDH